MQMEIVKIGDLRRKLGITQKELATLSGVSQSLIAKIESGKIDPAYSKAIAIFHALENQLSRKKHVKTAEEIMSRNVICAKPEDSLTKTMKTMRENAISQLPVMKSGNCTGSVSDDEFVDWVTRYGEGISKITVKEVMGESFPTIPANSDVNAVAEMLKFYKALLVKKEGEISGIITKSDLIKALSGTR